MDKQHPLYEQVENAVLFGDTCDVASIVMEQLGVKIEPQSYEIEPFIVCIDPLFGGNLPAEWRQTGLVMNVVANLVHRALNEGVIESDCSSPTYKQVEDATEVLTLAATVAWSTQ